MRRRKLGYTSLDISAVGMGTWAIGGDGYDCSLGAQDDKESIAAVRRCLDLGINWVDTAPMYGLGHAEEIIGKAIKNLRSQVIIATKCGILWDYNGSFSFSLRYDSVRAECEASLRRLRTDYIDLYQIHLPTTTEELSEAWECLSDLCREGKIRFAGVSNFTVEQMRMVQQIHPVASLQPVYNMFNRDIEQDILGFCQTSNIGVISHSPLGTGILSGQLTRERVRDLSQDDFRRKLPDFRDPQLSIHLKAIDQLKSIAKEKDLTLVQLAIGWVLRWNEITATIVGARSVVQVEELSRNCGVTLDADVTERVNAVLAGHKAEMQGIASEKYPRPLKSFIAQLFR